MWKVLGPGPEEEICSQHGDLVLLWQSDRHGGVNMTYMFTQHEAGLSPRHDLAVRSPFSVFSKDISATVFSASDD